MNCINCGAPMQLRLNQQHFYCEYCSSRYFPEQNMDGLRVLEANSEVSCPVCKIPLVHAYIGSTHLYHCQSCQGMLFHQETFLEVINYLRENSTRPLIKPPPVDYAELERKLNCPACRRLMSTHLYGGPGNLVVDNCSHCHHLWLDHNEFTRIIRSPGREPRSTDDEKSVDSSRHIEQD